jgi:hypothetical protein
VEKNLAQCCFPDPYLTSFKCRDLSLTSLYGCPTFVDGYFDCSFNKLQSLQYCPQIVTRDFYCSDNKLPSLQNIHKYNKQIDGELWVHFNPIKSYVLGVILIEKIKVVIFDRDNEHGDLYTVQNIINTHLETDRDVYLCQDNLIKAGFAEFAQL